MKRRGFLSSLALLAAPKSVLGKEASSLWTGRAHYLPKKIADKIFMFHRPIMFMPGMSFEVTFKNDDR